MVNRQNKMTEEIELTNRDPAKPVIVTIKITEFDYKCLKLIRAYFGEQDVSGLEHLAHAVLDKVIKQYTFPPDDKVFPG